MRCPHPRLLNLRTHVAFQARLATRIGEYSTVVNALAFVISYCVVNINGNKTANRVLFDCCLSLYHKVIIVNEDINEDSVNFVLKYVSFVGGKVRSFLLFMSVDE